MAKLTKEERQRNQLRRNRQLIGFVMSILVLIGCAAIITASANVISSIFDDSQEKAEYASKLSGLVMFDPLPFEGASNIQDTTLREAAVWGTIYSIMATESGFDNYEREALTDQIMLPSIEVDAYLAVIFGPDFTMIHKTFEMEGMTIVYDETLLCYYIPITSGVGDYTAVVEDMYKESGRLYVTVGYIPVDTSDSILTSTTATQIAKYMNYVFERTNGNWYLVALEESDLVAPAQVEESTTTSSVPALEDFEAVVLEDIANSVASAEESEESEENEASESEDDDTTEGEEDASSDSEDAA